MTSHKKADIYKVLRSNITYFVAVSFFLLCGIALLAAQRAVINPSIEDPAFANNSVVQAAEGTVPGWLTSHPVQAGACGGANCRPIERWSTGAVGGTLPATGAGIRWAELNAFTNSMIYQSVCMTNGESFGYSFAHRGRASATVDDVAQFRLGIPVGLPAGSKPADSYSFPIATVSTQNDGGGAAPTSHPNATVAFAAAGNGWRHYSGTFVYTGTTQVVNMGFVAISSAGGTLGAGNLIDDWQITLQPYLEFSPANASGAEGTVVGGTNTPANRPAIRIGGTVTAPIILNFQVTGGSAVIGDDYSLTVPFQAGNTTQTATVTIPIGTYDGTSAASLFPIPFSVSTDGTDEPDETVDFNITSAPGATIASVAGCGIAPIATSTYTILDDDLAPTAAHVSISGRVLTPDGRGQMNAIVTLTNAEGNSRTARSSSFGFYSFEEVPAGEAYLLTVSSKRYQFSPQVFMVNDDITDLNITALE